MKKKILLTIAVLAAISLGVVGMSAFEAHVINVTAQIENGLTVPLEASGLSFGTVFPEEVALQNMGIQLSNSFIATPRVDDIEYIIRQKPKCGVPVVPATNPISYSGFAQVTENSDGTFICPMVTAPGLTGPEQVQSVMLPLLCPYLSKHELDANGATTTNGIAAFHGPLTGWTMADTLATQVNGRLSKADGKTSTTWQLDLHAPCFKGMCAQDGVIPAAYEADPAFEHQMFGCDLWVEVRGVSLPGQPGTLTVTKIVEGGSKAVADFPLSVDGLTVTSGAATTTAAGSHVVTETEDQDYTAVFSGNCNSSGIVNVPAGGSAACTITNTFNVQPPAMGQLTVIKQVQGNGADPNSFTLFVDGMQVTNGVATTTTEGNHTVSEIPDSNYTLTFGGNCDSGGNVTVSSTTPSTCTLINTLNNGSITINKVLSPTDDPGKFNLQIDSATSGTGTNVGNGGTTGAVVVTPGVHSVGEIAGTGTNLDDYIMVIGGDPDCEDGSVTVDPTEAITCTITNTLKGGTITVIKQVSNPGDLSGVHSTGDFDMTIDGIVVAQNTQIAVSAGNHNISELDNFGYDVSFSLECPSGAANVSPNEDVTCTVTNTVPFATLTVNKIVNNGTSGGTLTAANFPLFIDGILVTNGVPKNIIAGSHIVSETGQAGYDPDITGSCTPEGSVAILAGESLVCTITNIPIKPTITLTKIIAGGGPITDVAVFTLKIDGVPVSSGGTKSVSAGGVGHVISEAIDPDYDAVIGGDAKCPSTVPGSTAALNLAENISCTITNTFDGVDDNL